MSGETGFTSDYIFFLQLEDRLPKYYFDLASVFGIINVTLVPLKPNELNKMQATEIAKNVIIITSSFTSQRKFLKLKSLFLDMSLRTEKFRFFHLSSFGYVSNYSRERHLGIYHFLPLPAKVDEVCYYIVSKVHHYEKSVQGWPGGRKARLPDYSI